MSEGLEFLSGLQLDDEADDSTVEGGDAGAVSGVSGADPAVGGGRPGRRRLARPKTQRSIQLPGSVARLVEEAGAHPADVIEQSWLRQGSAAAAARLVRSAERGRQTFRVRLPDDLYADLQASADRRGWTVSALVAAAIWADLSDS